MANNLLIIDPVLTLAGQAAAFNASNDGLDLKIDAVSFGRAHYDPTGDEIALVDPVGSKIPIAGGSRPTPYQLRLNVVWNEDVGQVPVGEIGYWSGNTLVFIWSKADGTIASYKTDGSSYVLFNDLAFAQVPANSISITINPDESAALAALGEHEGAKNAHPQYLLREDVAKDSGPLMGLVHSPGSAANALLLELDAPESVLPAYAKFQRFQFLAVGTNTDPVTVNIEGLGVKTVKRGGDAGLVDLEPGDIKAGALYDLNYDGTYFQLGGGVGSGKAFERFSFTAAVAQSEFTFPHVPGSVIGLRNGREIYDFTSSGDGSKVTLTTPCNIDDRMEFLAFKSFNVADAYTKAEINALMATAGAVPVGAMLPFPRGIVPPGFLEVDGSNFSAAVYPDLAAYLGGNTLPESRAEFLRGWDHGRGVDAGRVIGTYQADDIKSHNHALKSDGTGAQPGAGSADFVSGGANGSGNTELFGGSETRPRNLAVMWCIKAWNAPINQGVIDIAALAVALERNRTKLVARAASASIQVVSGVTTAPADFAPLSTTFEADGGLYQIAARLQMNISTVGVANHSYVVARLKNGATVLDTASLNVPENLLKGESLCLFYTGPLNGLVSLTVTFAKSSTAGSITINGDRNDTTSNVTGQISQLEILRLGDAA